MAEIGHKTGEPWKDS